MHARLALALSLALVPAVASAAGPRLGYQGRLLKSDGSPETGVLGIRFALFEQAGGGQPIWEEEQQLALSDGFYSTELGSTAALPEPSFDGRDLYLEVGAGGSPLSPRHKLASVPYALRAKSAVDVAGGKVEASEIWVGGAKVVDSGGKLAGPAAYLAGSGLELSNGTFSLLTSCASGQVLQWSGSAWTCAKAGVEYAAGPGIAISGGSISLPTGCGSGEVLRWSGTTWACGKAGPEYVAGPGISVANGAISLPSTCASGEVLRWNGAAWACAKAGPEYAAGAGIAIANGTISLPASCKAGEVLRFDGSAWACSAAAETAPQPWKESSGILSYTGGLVGIGASTAGAMLDVRPKDSSTNVYRASDSAGKYRWRIDQGFDEFITNSAGVDVVRIGDEGDTWFDNGGNVGVGTKDPSEKLTVGGQILTTVASPVSYSAGDQLVVADDAETGLVDDVINGYKLMKSFRVAKSGTARIRFTGYIQSGPKYWGWKIAKNGGNVLSQVGGAAAMGAYTANLDGQASAVHAYRPFKVDVTGLVPGDVVELWMCSTEGGASCGATAGQYLYAKDFRLFSGSPTVEGPAPRASPEVASFTCANHRVQGTGVWSERFNDAPSLFTRTGDNKGIVVSQKGTYRVSVVQLAYDYVSDQHCDLNLYVDGSLRHLSRAGKAGGDPGATLVLNHLLRLSAGQTLSFAINGSCNATWYCSPEWSDLNIEKLR